MSNGTTKPIRLSNHARGYLARRGFTEAEVADAIRLSRWRPTHQGRWETSREFAYNSDWNGTYYATKRVAAYLRGASHGDRRGYGLYVFLLKEQPCHANSL